jgi:peptide/nickel transport system substrate-binding protein
MLGRSMITRIAFVCALGLVASACGDDGGGTGDEAASTSTVAGATTTTLQPVSDGTLTFGAFTEPRGLDPTAGGSSGAGGSEPLMALYDTVVRFNPETRKYDMRTAESLTPSADFSEWTLKLKAGIKFSDGTDYNADAVKLSVERHQDAKNNSTARSYASFVKSMTGVDPLTLKFTLTDPWAGFPFLLSAAPGMVASPAAIASSARASA